MRIPQIRNIGITLNRKIHLLQNLIRLLLRKLTRLLLLILALLAHQYLLKLFGQDIDVPGKEREEVRIVEVDVEVKLLLLVSTGQVDIHSICDILLQNRYGLSYIVK